jgi:hypothetical protein
MTRPGWTRRQWLVAALLFGWLVLVLLGSCLYQGVAH